MLVLRAAKALKTETPPDCYCVVSLNEARIAHTAVTPKSNHPKWDERFILLVAHDIQEVVITVKDKDLLGSKFMGKARRRSHSIFSLYLKPCLILEKEPARLPAHPGGALRHQSIAHSRSVSFC